MPWYFLIAAILIALILVLWLLGASIEREHTATSTVELKASPTQVWQAINDWRTFQSWRKDLKSVEAWTGPDGQQGWVELSDWGRMPLAVERAEPERLFIGRIADDNLPFGGTWTHRLDALPNGGTRLSTTEHGHIKPAFFRLMARFLFGYHKTLNDYQKSLAAKFGETVAPTNS